MCRLSSAAGQFDHTADRFRTCKTNPGIRPNGGIIVSRSKLFSILMLAVLFFLSSCAQAADKETSLFFFMKNTTGDNPNGYYPSNKLLMDAAGNLYGATTSGAVGGWGTIFELSPNGSGAYSLTTIIDCSPTCSIPLGSLIMDGAGNLYGTAALGNVFELSPNGLGGFTGSVLYSFNGAIGSDLGNAPTPGLVVDSAGNLYGTNQDGGASNQGYVFELSPVSGGTWTLTHVHDFSGSDGAAPYATVIMDQAGNLYGTTNAGGTSTACTGGCGVVFKLTNNAGVWNESVLHSFNEKDGSNPQASLLMDASGNLYGTAGNGGEQNFGVVFELSPVSSGYHYRALYSFVSGDSDGAFPNTSLVMDSSGNLYGTTWSGGGGDCNFQQDIGCGTAFELARHGNNWKESLLHDFTAGGDGGFPGGLILGDGGNLFGTTEAGGAALSTGGIAFKLTSPGAPQGK
jgi:uncharacterized repeat protein (TIGR03803 family)